MEKNIVRLTEAEFKAAVSNTIKQAIQEEKKLIKENWAIDMITQLGDFVHVNAPTIYNKILSFDNQWNAGAGAYDFNDPDILQRANQAVGRILSLPLVGGTILGGSTAIAGFVNKYKKQIDDVKNAFMTKSLPKG